MGLPGCGTLNGSSKVLNCLFSDLKGSRFRGKGGEGVQFARFTIHYEKPSKTIVLAQNPYIIPPHTLGAPQNYNCNPEIIKNQPLHLHVFSIQNQRHRHPKTSQNQSRSGPGTTLRIKFQKNMFFYKNHCFYNGKSTFFQQEIFDF